MRILGFLLTTLLMSSAAGAEVPRVATDIAPVQSLVAQVMGGLGTPDLILSPTASPHSTALRPSQARALQAADIVVWIGPDLTPWLAKPIAALAPDAVVVNLLAAKGTRLRGFRWADPGQRDQDSEDGGGGIDPHAWLDPVNARLWLGLIADQLALADPDNADAYRGNAAGARAGLDQLSRQITRILIPAKDLGFITLHDAYQYFETRFGLVSSGTVSRGDSAKPGPARLAALRADLAGGAITCAFREPQFNDNLLRTITGDNDLEIATLDPLGSRLPAGADLYATMLRDMAQSIADCAGR
jgi:zinc transport system substrate-binding protein